MSKILRTWRMTVIATAVTTTLLAATACASTDADPAKQGSTESFPVSVMNCGAELTLDSAPQRLFLIGPDAIPILGAVEALGRVVALTGDVPEGVYDADLQQTVDAIPVAESKTGKTGGAVISSEVILAADPDLVIGPTNGVDAGALAAAGIPIYTPPAYCADSTTSGQTGTATFGWVEKQVDEYGTMLGATKAAAASNRRIGDQIADLQKRPASGLSAAALYVPEGGGTLYPYGAPSMVTPLFTAAGVENAYADSDERVFEASTEDLLDRDPDVIVLLYSAGDDTSVRQTFSAISAIKSLTAVRTKKVLTLPFAYTDPPTPLSVTGAEKLAQRLDEVTG